MHFSKSISSESHDKQGRGGYAGRGRRGGRGGRCGNYHQNKDVGSSHDQRPKCYYCKKPGHIKKFCRLKTEHAKFAEEKEKENETESLFMACFTGTCSS